MASQDLYVEYLTGLHRDELRLMARNQGIAGFSKMDRPELIFKLLEAKVQRASEAVVNQARLWNQGLSTTQQLGSSVEELESLWAAKREWQHRCELAQSKNKVVEHE